MSFLLLVELLEISLDGDVALDEANSRAYDWRGGTSGEMGVPGNVKDVDLFGAFSGAVLLLVFVEYLFSNSWSSDALADFTFKARRIPLGIAATPITRLPKVPIRAEAPPDMGSHGPSSRSYSLGRYLKNFRMRAR